MAQAGVDAVVGDLRVIYRDLLADSLECWGNARLIRQFERDAKAHRIEASSEAGTIRVAKFNHAADRAQVLLEKLATGAAEVDLLAGEKARRAVMQLRVALVDYLHAPDLDTEWMNKMDAKVLEARDHVSDLARTQLHQIELD